MASQGSPASAEYLIQFGRQGLVATPNRWRAEADQLYDAQNVSFDRDMAHRLPVARFYDFRGPGVPTFTGTWSASTTYTGIVGTHSVFPTAAGYFADVVKAGAAAQASPWVVTVTNTVAVSKTLILSIAALGTASFPITSVTDSKNNTWREVRQMGSSATTNVVVAQFECFPDFGNHLISGVDTITIRWGGGATAVALIVAAYDAGFQGEEGPNPSSLAYPTQTGTAVSMRTNAVTGLYPLLHVATIGASATLASRTLNTPNWNDDHLTQDQATGVQVNQLSEFVAGPTLLLAQHDFEAAAQSAVTGTLALTAGSRDIIGTGTTFVTELLPLDHLLVDGEEFTVEFVASATAVSVTQPAQRTAAGLTAQRLSGARIITAMSTGAAGFLYKEEPLFNQSLAPPADRSRLGILDQTTLKNNMKPTQRRGRFVEAGKEAAANTRKLLYFSGIDPVQVLSGDGTTTTAIATPPADWDTVANPYKQPINGIVHHDRLWAFGNQNEPHRIYYSTPDNHEAFTGTGSGSLRIASNIGRRLMGAATFRGVLFVFKYPRGIFYIDDTDIDFALWSYRAQSEGLGCAPSPHAVLPVDDDVLFVDPNGHLHLLSAVDSLGGVEHSNVTRALDLQDWTTAHIDRTGLSQLVSVYNPRTKIAYFGMRSVGNAYWQYGNNLMLLVDLSERGKGGPIRVSYSAWPVAANSLALRRQEFYPMGGEQTVLIGETSTAYLLLADTYGYVRYSDADRGYQQTLQTPELDLGDAQPALKLLRKQWQSLRIILGPGGLFTETATVTVAIDGIVRQTLTFSGTNRVQKLMLDAGDGFTIQVTITTPGTSLQDIQVLGLGIGYAVTSDDTGRVS